MTDALDLHLTFMRIALDEARKCVPTSTAFCVGAVITVQWSGQSNPVILSTGYSRELAGNTHAEANALAKARALSVEQLRVIVPNVPSDLNINTVLSVSEIYTTMEPCSVRTSGLAPCANALADARVRKCYIGVGEPDDFVKCEGAQKLRDAGVEVAWVKGLESECLEVARLGH